MNLRFNLQVDQVPSRLATLHSNRLVSRLVDHQCSHLASLHINRQVRLQVNQAFIPRNNQLLSRLECLLINLPTDLLANRVVDPLNNLQGFPRVSRLIILQRSPAHCLADNLPISQPDYQLCSQQVSRLTDRHRNPVRYLQGSLHCNHLDVPLGSHQLNHLEGLHRSPLGILRINPHDNLQGSQPASQLGAPHSSQQDNLLDSRRILLLVNPLEDRPLSPHLTLRINRVVNHPVSQLVSPVLHQLGSPRVNPQDDPPVNPQENHQRNPLHSLLVNRQLVRRGSLLGNLLLSLVEIQQGSQVASRHEGQRLNRLRGLRNGLQVNQLINRVLIPRDSRASSLLASQLEYPLLSRRLILQFNQQNGPAAFQRVNQLRNLLLNPHPDLAFNHPYNLLFNLLFNRQIYRQFNLLRDLRVNRVQGQVRSQHVNHLESLHRDLPCNRQLSRAFTPVVNLVGNLPNNHLLNQVVCHRRTLHGNLQLGLPCSHPADHQVVLQGNPQLGPQVSLLENLVSNQRTIQRCSRRKDQHHSLLLILVVSRAVGLLSNLRDSPQASLVFSPLLCPPINLLVSQVVNHRIDQLINHLLFRRCSQAADHRLYPVYSHREDQLSNLRCNR